MSFFARYGMDMRKNGYRFKPKHRRIDNRTNYNQNYYKIKYDNDGDSYDEADGLSFGPSWDYSNDSDTSYSDSADDNYYKFTDICIALMVFSNGRLPTYTKMHILERSVYDFTPSQILTLIK